MRARRFPHPFTMLLIFAAAKWVLARLALLFWKLPPLAFQPGAWRPYLGAVAATGAAEGAQLTDESIACRARRAPRGSNAVATTKCSLRAASIMIIEDQRALRS